MFAHIPSSPFPASASPTCLHFNIFAQDQISSHTHVISQKLTSRILAVYTNGHEKGEIRQFWPITRDNA